VCATQNQSAWCINLRHSRFTRTCSTLLLLVHDSHMVQSCGLCCLRPRTSETQESEKNRLAEAKVKLLTIKAHTKKRSEAWLSAPELDELRGTLLGTRMQVIACLYLQAAFRSWQDRKRARPLVPGRGFRRAGIAVLACVRWRGIADDICAVCLDPPVQRVHWPAGCGHTFCKSCAERCLKRSKYCPVCRTAARAAKPQKREPIAIHGLPSQTAPISTAVVRISSLTSSTTRPSTMYSRAVRVLAQGAALFAA